jgi:hypothetical protein
MRAAFRCRSSCLVKLVAQPHCDGNKSRGAKSPRPTSARIAFFSRGAVRSYARRYCAPDPTAQTIPLAFAPRPKQAKRRAPLRSVNAVYRTHALHPDRIRGCKLPCWCGELHSRATPHEGISRNSWLLLTRNLYPFRFRIASQI